VLLLLPGALAHAEEDDRAVLLDGVRSIARPGVPGPVALVGEDAFALVAAEAGGGVRLPVVAASRLGRGRIVAFGHGGYLTKGPLETRDTARLVLNALAWLGGRRERPRVGVVGNGALAAFLEAQTVDVRRLPERDWASSLAGVDVVCVTDPDAGGAGGAKALDAFLRRGGGLLTAGLAWGWLQLNPGASLSRDHRLNAVLAPAGLFFADGTVDEVLPVGTPPADLDACHAGRAVARLAAGDASEALGAVVSSAWRSLPEAERGFDAAVRRLVEDTAPAVPTRERPLRRSDPLGRLAVLVAHVDASRLPPERVRAAPSAADFPGAVPEDAKRVRREVRVDPSVPGWASTGLYAPPGEAITVRLGRDAPAGLALRIGAHTDRLWALDAWRRHPEVSVRLPLGRGATKAASPHGGLVYVDVPEGCAPGALDVRVEGAVEAPFFVLGTTDPAAWRETIRMRQAPWAELAATRVVLTVPSAAVRGLDDPTEVLSFWDGVLDLYAELGQRPLGRRPERFVSDRQPVAGWLHAGHPIVMQMQHADMALDLSRMRDVAPTDVGAWGFWHELGHNHQRPEWTFDGTGEVTCNLFTLFVEQRVRGVAPVEHPWATRQWPKAKAYLEGDRAFARWKQDPGLALWTYILLQEAFGWEAFERVFAAYAAMPPGERPKEDAAKRDRWLVVFSKTVGHDLGPYLAAWGIPLSAAARAEVAALEPWMPARMERGGD